MPKSKFQKLQEVLRLHDLWLHMVLFGKDSIEQEDYEQLKEYGKLPLDMDLSKVFAVIEPDVPIGLIKADIGSPTRTPMGPKSAASTIPASTQPADIKKPAKPKSGIDHSNLIPISKKQHPKRPEGVVDETEHTWYVMPGKGTAAPKKTDTPGGGDVLSELLKIERAYADAKEYVKQKHPPAVELNHLGKGEIVQKVPIGENEKGINEAFRVLIKGNGEGLMKSNSETVDALYAIEGQGVFAGGNTIPPGTHTKREEASYKMAMGHGLTDHVPATTQRNHEGKSHSVQKWMEGMGPGSAMIRKRLGRSPTNVVGAILMVAPEDAREHVKNKLQETVVFDIIQNNNDRHHNNLIWNSDFSDFRLIDGGFSHGNGVDGIRNEIHADFHNRRQKVTIPEKMKARLEKMSLGDYKKMNEDLEEWEAGQSFLRNRYVLHLQKTEGHLDFEKFRPIVSNYDGSRIKGYNHHWDHLPEGELEYRKEKGLLPNQIFESWAKHFINEAANDKNHPDHLDALELKIMGVFMGPGASKDPKAYRRANKHIAYEASITPKAEIPVGIRRDVKPTVNVQVKNPASSSAGTGNK